MKLDLSRDRKIKLKKLLEDKNYTKFEFEIEKLGKVENLPTYLMMGYAGSKVINPKSKKEDFVKSTVIFEKCYKEDKSNLEALYNLIVASMKAETTNYVFSHLLEKYETDKKDLKIIEGIARVHFLLGNMDLTVKFFKQLLDLSPKNTIDGGRLTYLASMNYPSGIKQSDYYEECKILGEKFSKFSKFSKYIKNLEKNNKIRIGFVSGDLRTHSVNFFLKDIFSKIDKDQFSVIGFNNLEKSRFDKVTDYYKKYSCEWYDVYDYSDEKLIDLIRSLKIDILIDLNGFTYGNRINIFAARCAKIQIAWLGYNNSLGLSNMDYLVVDKNLIHKNEENLYREKILYLPKIWNAMSKPKNLPEINELPFIKGKIFKYGSFNSFKKISNDTIKVWSSILNKTNSQIYLKNSGGYNKELYDNLLNKFIKQNVDPNKIFFMKRSSEEEFLKDYNKIDIALDTFPYPGVTTSYQSYLMGVPVLTMKGFNLNSRCGESINLNLNLKELIAENYDEYVKKAIMLQDRVKLSDLRKTLRKKVLNSPLFDTEDFTKQISKIFKQIL
jgi:protein O-GlcNAc transferase